MMFDWAMAKSYTVLLIILAILWVPECFMETVLQFLAATTQNTNIIIKRQGYTATA